MRILDLYCGAGLVADGLVAAGWEVVGVDIAPQPRYQGAFLQHNVLTLDPRFIRSFDALWASPPCLKDTELHASARREQAAHGGEVTVHADLITPTRPLLVASGLPYVIENVRNTKLLLNPVTLCGSMFNLGVEDGGVRYHLERHRKFETNWGLAAPAKCRHVKPCVGVYGGHARVRSKKFGGRGTKEPWTRSGAEIMREAMGLTRYLTVEEVGQGIPPAYSRYVGEKLVEHIEYQRWAA